MAGIGNNLYPPIVASWMPAFVRTTPCKLYFSLSSYNATDEIKNVQVIVSNQNSSLSALDASQYPAGIKITDLEIDPDVIGDDRYYVIISPDDLQDGIFEIGQYYKVQLRFTGAEATTLTDPTKIAGWLTDNQPYFSEWSTVCLIKGIELPKIYLRGFENTETAESGVISFTKVIDLVGRMYYDENEDLESEYLQSYQIDIYSGDYTSLVYSSEVIYTNEYYPNEINYTIKTNLVNGIEYTLDFNFTTVNGYTDVATYKFYVASAFSNSLEATITAEPDVENGRILINILGKNTSSFLGNLCIRRSSSEDGFTVWEDIKIDTVTIGGRLNYNWYDYTVKSGVYYNYCAQRIDTKGNRSSIITIARPVMLYLDDMFLTREEMQLRIRYSPSISSFKVNFSESKTDTIGSKYPYIRRNGNVAYKSFPISGLITEFCDSDRLFSSRAEFYGDMEEYYDDFNEEEQITEYRDFIYEREFREKVMNFLHGNDVKLFRSLTEGNVLVKLMDISFTPNATLGRMLYTFSATAYEIDECTIDNYDKYGILTLGKWQDYIEYSYPTTGQINETVFEADVDIIDELADKYYYKVTPGYYNTILYLSWVRIEFQQEPYLIYCGKDGSLTPLTEPDDDLDNTVYGYIVYINEQPILVSARGYYELNDEDTQVTSIYFPVETNVIIDYTVWIREIEDSSLIASRIYNYVKVGQLWGIFDIETSISNQIFLKYYETYSTYYQELISIDRITVEASTGTIVYVKDSFDDDYYRHEVGPTGTLDFYTDEATIAAFYFSGVHLLEMENPERLEAEEWEYRETGISVGDVSEITRPIKNGVYTIATPIKLNRENAEVPIEGTRYSADAEQYDQLIQTLVDNSNNRYIYYHDDWYVFTEDDVALCPITGLVDYIFELERGEY